MKFTLRDFLAVVTIVALSLGWVLDRWKLVKLNKAWAAENRHLEHSLDVYFAWALKAQRELREERDQGRRLRLENRRLREQ